MKWAEGLCRRCLDRQAPFTCQVSGAAADRLLSGPESPKDGAPKGKSLL